MLEFIEWLQSSDYIKGIAFAIFGGFVRVFVTTKGRLRFKTIFSGMLAASFVGIVGIELINYYNLNKSIIGLVNALAGYCHKEMINLVTNRFLAKFRKTGDDGKF
jgi:hypothetical protein